MPNTTTYKGYTIDKDLFGYYVVTPPNGLPWRATPFILLDTAKKFIDAHIIERQERSDDWKKGS